MLETFMNEAMNREARAVIGESSLTIAPEKFKKSAILFVKGRNAGSNCGSWKLSFTSDEPVIYQLGPVAVYCDHYYAIVNFGESYVLFRRSEERKDLIVLEDDKNIYVGFESGNKTFIASQVSKYFVAVDSHAVGKFKAREHIADESSSNVIKGPKPAHKKKHRRQPTYSK